MDRRNEHSAYIDSLIAESSYLKAEGDRLRVEGNRLRVREELFHDKWRAVSALLTKTLPESEVDEWLESRIASSRSLPTDHPRKGGAR